MSRKFEEPKYITKKEFKTFLNDKCPNITIIDDAVFLKNIHCENFVNDCFYDGFRSQIFLGEFYISYWEKSPESFEPAKGRTISLAYNTEKEKEKVFAKIYNCLFDEIKTIKAQYKKELDRISKSYNNIKMM